MNVQFLKGTQTELNGKTSYQAGAFYLTEDTERLYYAKDNNNLLYLNKYVITVADKSNLPAIASVNPGDLYYIKNINVLCTKQDSSSTAWTQINTNTDQAYRTTGLNIKSLTTDEIGALSNLGIESGKEDQYLVFSLKVNQKKKDFINGGTESDITSAEEASESHLVIPIADVINNLSVGVVATKEANGIKISTTGSGSDPQKTILITGSGDASISSTDDGFNVSAAPYDIAFDPGNQNSNPKIILKKDGTDKTTIDVTPGLDIDFSGSGNNSFKINHKEYTYKAENELPEAQTDYADSTFNIITGVEVTNGHITAVKKGTVKLPTFVNSDTRLSGVSFNSDGSMSFAMKDVLGNDLDPIDSDKGLYYTFNGTRYYNQADLSNVVATKADLVTLNAMVYKGTLNSQTEYEALQAEEKVKIGYTYLVNAATLEFNADKQKAKRGDLLIATSAKEEEESNGYIAKEDIVWTKVESGDEVDTQYELSSSGTDIILKASTDLTENQWDKVTLGTEDGGAIDIVGEAGNIININHKKPTITETDSTSTATSISHGGDFLAISDIAVNEYGHITAYTAKKYQLPSDNNTTYYITADSTSSPSKAILKSSQGSDSGSIKVVGDTNTPIVVTTASNATNLTSKGDITFTVAHGNVTATDTQAPGTANSLASGGTLTYVKEVKRNAQGHVTEIVRDKVTLFKDTTYTLSGATIASSTSNGTTTLTVTDTLKDSNEVKTTSAFSLSSSSLALSANEKTITMNLEWGSF